MSKARAKGHKSSEETGALKALASFQEFAKNVTKKLEIIQFGTDNKLLDKFFNQADRSNTFLKLQPVL